MHTITMYRYGQNYWHLPFLSDSIFPRYSNSLAALLNLVHFIIEACMNLKRTKISEDMAH